MFVSGDNRFNGSVFAYKIDSSDARLWDWNGVLISSRSHGELDATTDGNGGIIVLGSDDSDFSIRLQQCSRNGLLGDIATGILRESVELPVQVRLYQNYPNPFNPVTTIEFALPSGSQADLAVYDLLGRRIQTILNGYYVAGDHRVGFYGAFLASRAYYYVLKLPTAIQVRRFSIIK